MEGVCGAVHREPLLPTGLLPKFRRREAAYLNHPLHRRPRIKFSEVANLSRGTAYRPDYEVQGLQVAGTTVFPTFLVLH